MAQVITLSKHRTQAMIGNRRGTGKAKQIIKAGMFNVNQFCNWITGFKTDEVSHSSPVRQDIHRPQANVKRRYF